jgi:hypothetical protein
LFRIEQESFFWNFANQEKTSWITSRSFGFPGELVASRQSRQAANAPVKISSPILLTGRSDSVGVF